MFLWCMRTEDDMKIHIGDYIDWFGPYQLADSLKSFISKNLYQKIQELPEQPFQWLHDRKKRRIKIHLDPWDTYNAEETLARIVAPVLKQLKKTIHGAPANMQEFSQVSSSSTQLCLDFYEAGDSDAWKEGHKRWLSILDKMIWSFEQLADPSWEDAYSEGVPDIEWKKKIDSVTGQEVCEMVRGPKDTYKFNYEGYTDHVRRIQEGLDFFGKHYRSLWD